MNSEQIIQLYHELKRLKNLERQFGPKLGVTKYTVCLDLKGGCTDERI